MAFFRSRTCSFVCVTGWKYVMQVLLLLCRCACLCVAACPFRLFCDYCNDDVLLILVLHSHHLHCYYSNYCYHLLVLCRSVSCSFVRSCERWWRRQLRKHLHPIILAGNGVHYNCRSVSCSFVRSCERWRGMGYTTK